MYNKEIIMSKNNLFIVSKEPIKLNDIYAEIFSHASGVEPLIRTCKTEETVNLVNKIITTEDGKGKNSEYRKVTGMVISIDKYFEYESHGFSLDDLKNCFIASREGLEIENPKYENFEEWKEEYLEFLFKINKIKKDVQ